MRTLLVAAAATVTAGVLAGTVGGATARVDQIAFTNARVIWVIGSDGSGLRQVTHSPYSDGGIAWSRDGRLIAFTRYFKPTNCPEDQNRGDLYLIGSNGKNERRLTSTGCSFSPPSHPAFAPKGQTLAFDGDKGIFLARPLSWKPTRVSGPRPLPELGAGRAAGRLRGRAHDRDPRHGHAEDHDGRPRRAASMGAQERDDRVRRVQQPALAHGPGRGAQAQARDEGTPRRA